MAERFLDRSYVVAIFQKVRRERVTECVAANAVSLRGRYDTEDGAVPSKPFGPMGLRAISLSEAVTDERASLSASLLDLARKTHRRWYR